MKYSKLFGKTLKESPKDATLASHKLLYQAGYIRESTAGRYYLLPLGLRVQQKMQQIIKEEMDNAGAQEMLAPVLHPKYLWQETNRTNSVGFELMSIIDRNEMEFVLGGTAEEMMVDVVRKFQISYKDLPFNIYQFSIKFRDEMRARGGLLRLREFIMKDAYSFHQNEEDFRLEYDKMMHTYTGIFHRLGLKTLIVESDNGYIGGEYCHEFIVESPAGESKFYMTEDGSYAAHEEVAKFKLDYVNEAEKLLPMEIIDQPEWVKTMEDNLIHYGKDKSFFLKNVVYKASEGDIVIVVIRGDLEVNAVKLGHLLKHIGALETASIEDLKAIGTKPGYVHSWGHTFIKSRKTKTGDRNCKVVYVADDSLKTVHNFIGGQKEDKSDSINVNYGRDFKHDFEGDVAMVQEGFISNNGKKLIAKRGVEVGNIFQLGFHYSSRMKDASFADAKGEKKPFYMGCYGIGLARTLSTIVEIYNNENGIMWPLSVAPFQVHLIGIWGKEAEIKVRTDKLYMELTAKGIEVLFDDREDISTGQRFGDADLIGIPVRLVISPKTGDNFEWKQRDKSESELVTMETIIRRLGKHDLIQAA